MLEDWELAWKGGFLRGESTCAAAWIALVFTDAFFQASRVIVWYSVCAIESVGAQS